MPCKVEDRLGTKQEQVLPITTLREKWQTVAWDGLLALLCNVPGFGMLLALWLFIKYSVLQVHLIAQDMTKRQWVVQLLAEATVWASLAMRCVRDVQVYHGHLNRVAAAVHAGDEGDAASHEIVKKQLEGTFQTMSFDLFGSAMLIASTLLWRILNFNMIQIQAHVFFHRKRAREKIDKNQKATDIWKHLSQCGLDGFDDLDKEMEEIPQANLKEELWQWMKDVKEKGWEKLWFDIVLILGSSLSMFVGTLMLHFEHVQRHSKGTHKPRMSFSFVTLLFAIAVSTVQATFFWTKIISGVLRRTRQFRAQSNRLLLLAAISTPYLEHTWSKTNLDHLDAMLKAATESSENKESKEVGIKIHKDKKIWQVEVVDKKLELDLTKNVEDISAWWQLRSFLQIDCLDKAAIVEFCSIVVVCLLVNFAVVGLVGYMAEHRIVTIGFVLLLVLSGVLIAIMFMLLQACVTTNAFMEASSERLRVAAQQIMETETEQAVGETRNSEAANALSVPPPVPDSTVSSLEKKAMLLHVIERRASSSNDRQQLFGIPVTSNLRNGWILSLGLAFGTSLWKIVGAYVNRLDVAALVTELVKRWQKTS